MSYANALDERDWVSYRRLFTDQIAIDYGAIGSIVATICADDWTTRCRALEGFDATAHQLHNIQAVIDTDRAIVTCIVNAAHFITVKNHTLHGDLIARYTHRLVRIDGWKVAAVALAVIGYPSGQKAFAAAFAAARSRYSERVAA